MEGGNVFKRTGNYCFAQATEVMNSKSPHDFLCSVRLTDHIPGRQVGHYKIGIASKWHNRITNTDPNGERKPSDENAICFYRKWPTKNVFSITKKGQYQFDKEIDVAREDEIHFRLQSKLKKFSISLVSSIIGIRAIFKIQF